MTRMTKLDRFLSHIQKQESGCWLWTGCKTKAGYGFFGGDNKNVLAHRYAYQQFIGKIGDGLSVCHRCDNPSCVNPAHLYAANHRTNIADRDAKNRLAFGQRHGMAKLTEAKVVLLKKILNWDGPVNQAAVARHFGVNVSTIYQISAGRQWRKVVA